MTSSNGTTLVTQCDLCGSVNNFHSSASLSPFPSLQLREAKREATLLPPPSAGESWGSPRLRPPFGRREVGRTLGPRVGPVDSGRIRSSGGGVLVGVVSPCRINLPEFDPHFGDGIPGVDELADVVLCWILVLADLVFLFSFGIEDLGFPRSVGMATVPAVRLGFLFPWFRLLLFGVFSTVEGKPGGLLQEIKPAWWCRCLLERWCLGAPVVAGGGVFGCSPPSLAVGGAEGRNREARGVSPADELQPFRSRRWWRVVLEVQKTKHGAVSMLGVGPLRSLLRRQRRWTSTAGSVVKQEDPQCFQFFAFSWIFFAFALCWCSLWLFPEAVCLLYLVCLI